MHVRAVLKRLSDKECVADGRISSHVREWVASQICSSDKVHLVVERVGMPRAHHVHFLVSLATLKSISLALNSCTCPFFSPFNHRCAKSLHLGVPMQAERPLRRQRVHDMLEEVGDKHVV